MSPRFFTTLRSVLNDKNNKGMIIYIYVNIHCHPERSEGSREHSHGVIKIFSPLSRLNDKIYKTKND